MIKRHYNKTNEWIERNRFVLLLLATVMVLVLPAFSGRGSFSEIIYLLSLSFLFVQSMVAADVSSSKKSKLRVIVISMIVLSWMDPAEFDSIHIKIATLAFCTAFFIFVISFLLRFIANSATINRNVLITSINIYLLVGIIGANLSLAFYLMYTDAYNFPAYIEHPVLVDFLYYSFITMSTVGYGDITPRIPETQTLAYFISITGQLYVAIIIAFLIGKLLMQGEHKKRDS